MPNGVDAAPRGLRNGMKSNAGTAGRRRKADRADPLGANSEIGRKLRQYYEDLVEEEVPDRFADLLKQLEKSEQAAHSRDGE